MEESSSGGGADRGGGDAGDSLRNASQGKSCKGCLYYSSLLRSDSRNPFCLGLTRPLKQVVPSSIVGESEMEADKEGRSLSDFRYVCVGYSVFLNNKENTTENQENQAKLPFCVGLELLVDRKTSAAEHVPTHVHNKEGNIMPQLFLQSLLRNLEDTLVYSQLIPIHSHREEAKMVHSPQNNFFSKFSRSAGLVASGVVKNLVRVGYSIKNNFEDILYDRRRPK
ncbi:hypothetical protein MUK42_10702 [Musa troglodytarum]|uniref:DUF8204 domain-containing protein n=1 Tax=Musa troglodytarum TaxID=320322 RepID=A0A9E7GN79_9LILI|nr:hypothetical protein MUK42_10702 [Musa troglodytarum]